MKWVMTLIWRGMYSKTRSSINYGQKRKWQDLTVLLNFSYPLIHFFRIHYNFNLIVNFFPGIELQVLKEEFSHHQEKIDQYYSLLKDAENSDESKLMFTYLNF